jgi:hypothetical protein
MLEITKMDVDMILSISAGCGLAACGLCMLVCAWRNARLRPTMKTSKSEESLSSLV